MKTKSKRSYHHGDLRRTLLDVTHALVAERGIQAVTMSEVAKRSGVSSGAPYRHFKDRRELLTALAERGHDQLSARTAALAASAPTVLEAFRRTGVEYVRFAVDEPVLFTLMSRGEFSSRDRESQNPADQRFVQALAQVLTQGDTDAPLDPKEPVLQEFAARCMMHGLAHFIVDGALSVVGADEAQAQRIADAMTKALGPMHPFDSDEV